MGFKFSLQDYAEVIYAVEKRRTKCCCSFVTYLRHLLVYNRRRDSASYALILFLHSFFYFSVPFFCFLPFALMSMFCSQRVPLASKQISTNLSSIFLIFIQCERLLKSAPIFTTLFLFVPYMYLRIYNFRVACMISK